MLALAGPIIDKVHFLTILEIHRCHDITQHMGLMAGQAFQRHYDRAVNIKQIQGNMSQATQNVQGLHKFTSYLLLG